MDCPYCGTKMTPGLIPGDRYSLKWFSKEDYNKSFFHFRKGIKLTNVWEYNRMDAHLCHNCKKLIIDVSEQL